MSFMFLASRPIAPPTALTRVRDLPSLHQIVQGVFNRLGGSPPNYVMNWRFLIFSRALFNSSAASAMS